MTATLLRDTSGVQELGVVLGPMASSCPTAEEEFVDFPGLVAPKTRSATSSLLPRLLVFARQAGCLLQHSHSTPPLPNLPPMSVQRTSNAGRRQELVLELASLTNVSAPNSSASNHPLVDVSRTDLPLKELTVGRGGYAPMEFARRQRRQLEQCLRKQQQPLNQNSPARQSPAKVKERQGKKRIKSAFQAGSRSRSYLQRVCHQ